MSNLSKLQEFYLVKLYFTIFNYYLKFYFKKVKFILTIFIFFICKENFHKFTNILIYYK